MGGHKHGRNMASAGRLSNGLNSYNKPWRNGTLENNNYLVNGKSKSTRYGRKSGFYLQWKGYGLVALAAVVCYMNGMGGDLVHDDVMTIRTNPDVRPSTPLSNIFLDDFWGRPMSENSSHKSYRPLCILTFRLNYSIHGLNPWGYHVVNVLLHLAVSLIFTYICSGLVCSSPQMACLAGLLFAVHPIHAEAVTGIVGRADVLAAFLFLLSFLCYTRSVEAESACSFPRTSSPSMFLTSLLLAGCAMLVKEHGMTVLAVSLVYDIVIMCHQGMLRIVRERCLLKESYPLLKRILIVILSIVIFLGFRLSMMYGQQPAFIDQDNPASFSPYLLTRVLTYMYLWVCNGWLLLCPVTLSYDWQMDSIPLIHSVLDPRNLATLMFIGTMTVIILHLFHQIKRQGQESRQLLTGLALLVIPFLPAANIFLRVGFVVAERLLYISSMGYVLLLVHGLERLMLRYENHKPTLYRLAYLLCVIWTCRALVRNQVWYSRKTLFRSGLQTLPLNAKMHYNYANYLKDNKLRTQAIFHYQETLRLWPRHASANNNLGTMMYNPEDAIKCYHKAIEINPRHGGAHFNLGNTLYQQGQKEEALSMLWRAVEVDPENADSHRSLAAVLTDLGNIKEAEHHYLTAIYLRPTDGDVYNNYGVFLNKQNKYAEALVQYQKAFYVQSNHHIAIINAAKMCRKLGRSKEAEEHLIRATQLSRDVDTLDYAGVFYFNNGREKKAIEYFEEALREDPEHIDVSLHYAQALSNSQRYDEAEQWFLKVLHQNPQHTEALHQLANTLGMQGKHHKAVQYLNQAIQYSKGTQQLGNLYFDLGNHYKDAGDLNSSLEAFLKCLEYNKDFGEVHLNLGVLYHVKGNLEKARYHYSEAKRKIPDNPILIENLKKLEASQKLSRRKR